MRVGVSPVVGLCLLVSWGCGDDGSSNNVVPGYTDGNYTEDLPDPDADISDLVAAYEPSQVKEFVMAVLARRYPVGQKLVAGGEQVLDCIGIFLADISSAQAVIQQLGTVVHECGHMYDGSQGSGNENAYVITQSLVLDAAQGDSIERGGLTFARSRIRNDPFSADRKPCNGTFGAGCDFYAVIYLDGDPDNSAFEGGDQGFNMLLEETVQYVNSLATALAFTNELRSSGAVSHRDGILTFLWYSMRYLHMARLEHPDAYEHLLHGDNGRWRHAILTVWGRAWLYLDATKDMPYLGNEDEAILPLVEDPKLQDEIQRLRIAEGPSDP